MFYLVCLSFDVCCIDIVPVCVVQCISVNDDSLSNCVVVRF